MDIFGLIMWPFKIVIEAILVAWHWLFSVVGIPAESGIGWILSIVGLVVVVRSAMIPLMVK
ncbi:MAG TPA: membrane protein insertase YidC, partial [Pseudoclavibacter sp.]|nr:membrane protein insertase YidC [Pseudoclavibacter sp.]